MSGFLHRMSLRCSRACSRRTAGAKQRMPGSYFVRIPCPRSTAIHFCCCTMSSSSTCRFPSRMEALRSMFLLLRMSRLAARSTCCRLHRSPCPGSSLHAGSFRACSICRFANRTMARRSTGFHPCSSQARPRSMSVRVPGTSGSRSKASLRCRLCPSTARTCFLMARSLRSIGCPGRRRILSSMCGFPNRRIFRRSTCPPRRRNLQLRRSMRAFPPRTPRCRSTAPRLRSLWLSTPCTARCRRAARRSRALRFGTSFASSMCELFRCTQSPGSIHFHSGMHTPSSTCSAGCTHCYCSIGCRPRTNSVRSTCGFAGCSSFRLRSPHLYRTLISSGTRELLNRTPCPGSTRSRSGKPRFGCIARTCALKGCTNSRCSTRCCSRMARLWCTAGTSAGQSCRCIHTSLRCQACSCSLRCWSGRSSPPIRCFPYTPPPQCRSRAAGTNAACTPRCACMARSRPMAGRTDE
jgi:hypothetical protein